MITDTAPVRPGARPHRRAGGTLDDLLSAWLVSPDDSAPCLICDGETFRVRRRSGALAVVCRSCGTTLEKDAPVGRSVDSQPHDRRAVLRVA